MSKIISDDELDAFKNDLETVLEAKYVEREKIIRADLERALVLSSSRVADIANANIEREQAAMMERI